MGLLILQLSCKLFFLGGGGKNRITQVCQPPCSPDLAPYDFWLFPKLKSPLKGRRLVNETVTQYRRSQLRLTADWLILRESDCSRMHSKVSSNWLPNFIKVTRPVLEIFKMARYFPDRPRILSSVARLAVPYFCTLSHKTARYSEKESYWTQNVFWFSTTALWNI